MKRVLFFSGQTFSKIIVLVSYKSHSALKLKKEVQFLILMRYHEGLIATVLIFRIRNWAGWSDGDPTAIQRRSDGDLTGVFMQFEGIRLMRVRISNFCCLVFIILLWILEKSALICSLLWVLWWYTTYLWFFLSSLRSICPMASISGLVSFFFIAASTWPLRDFSKVKSNLALFRLLLFDLADLLLELEAPRLVRKSSKSFQTGLLLSFAGLFLAGTFSFKMASATRASIEAAGRSSNFGLNKAEVINLIKLAEKHVCCWKKKFVKSKYGTLHK